MGTATPRQFDRNGRPVYVPIPVYTGWGFWSPWYGFGYRGLHGFGPYYSYYPFGYYGYGPGYLSYGGYAADVAGPASEPELTGSIRFEVTPDTARIYIDGALVGTASDFDTDHLDLAAGGYRLEIRADGYQTYSADVLVKAGQTMTERITLKRE